MQCGYTSNVYYTPIVNILISFVKKYILIYALSKLTYFI